MRLLICKRQTWICIPIRGYMYTNYIWKNGIHREEVRSVKDDAPNLDLKSLWMTDGRVARRPLGPRRRWDNWTSFSGSRHWKYCWKKEGRSGPWTTDTKGRNVCVIVGSTSPVDLRVDPRELRMCVDRLPRGKNIILLEAGYFPKTEGCGEVGTIMDKTEAIF